MAIIQATSEGRFNVVVAGDVVAEFRSLNAARVCVEIVEGRIEPGARLMQSNL